jgi:hypothetical protein
MVELYLLVMLVIVSNQNICGGCLRIHWRSCRSSWMQSLWMHPCLVYSNATLRQALGSGWCLLSKDLDCLDVRLYLSVSWSLRWDGNVVPHLHVQRSFGLQSWACLQLCRLRGASLCLTELDWLLRYLGHMPKPKRPSSRYEVLLICSPLQFIHHLMWLDGWMMSLVRSALWWETYV